MKNILLATYGTTSYIILELLGFTNPEDFPCYANHSKKAIIDQSRLDYDIRPIDELWLITTSAKEAQNAYNQYKTWHTEHLPHIALHRIFNDGICDIRTSEDCMVVRDLIFRAVLAAHEETHGGQLTLSLLGGYKTLSADIQEAGNIFGCHALLHVLVNDNQLKPGFKTTEELEGNLPQDSADAIMPVVVSGKKERAAYLYHRELIENSLKENPVLLDVSTPVNSSLVKALAELQSDAGVILSNFSQAGNNMSPIGNFRSLSLLHPRIINALKSDSIDGNEKDTAWLQALPKAELHCHFGGILTPDDMIDVAMTEVEKVVALEKDNSDFSSWLDEIRRLIFEGNKLEIRNILDSENKQSLRTPCSDLPEPYAICGFLSLFKGRSDLLDEIIYGEKRQIESFVKIGIKAYEHLGDLQGSALMQSEKCLRRACRLLIDKCRKNHIIYMEVRCSPMNYTRGGLNGADVVRILLEELAVSQDTYFTFLFIASRHGRMSDVYRHIELTEDLFENKYGWPSELANLFKERFVGFDLAGSEQSRSPKQLREAFEPLHRRCLNLTIHAGETADAEKIWEAVYFLNADRIGHGLTLGEQPELLDRFMEHRTTVEMCPSSNFQIVGFRDYQLESTKLLKEYPLQSYMAKGIRVTINTDDPGISRTDITNEFLKAARMTPGGLSKWDILQLVYNSFTASFAHFDKRRAILLKAEDEIITQLKEQYGTR